MEVRTCLLSAASVAFSAALVAAELPILGFGGVPTREVSVARYRQARDAGFTHLMQWAADAESLRKYLDCAQEAGVKLLVNLKQDVDPVPVVREFRKHPALGLWHLGDEPDVPQMAKMGARARAIQAADPDHPCYLNWFGVVNAEPARWYGAPDYRAYIAASLKAIPTRLLSFDKYPVARFDLKAPKPPYRDVPGLVLNPKWYETLEIVRETSRAERKPFWAFALSVAHHIGDRIVYPTPTEAQMKLQHYSNLAYGAQGLQYYTYWQPVPPGPFGYHDAPIAGDGRPTFVYDRVRRVNRELQARAFVFVGADARDVWHAGGEVPPWTRPLDPKALPARVRALVVDGGAVVSHLVNGDAAYLLVVNRELDRDVALRVELEPGCRRIREDGSAVPVDAHAGEYVLGPGAAEIFRL